jgi:RNA polymerase sigma-70 factor (ECF subfamily)
MVLPVARAQDLPKLRLVGGRAVERRGERQGLFDELADAQLVSLVAEGDRGAFEALYRRHAPFALGLAIRIQGSANDVEDVVHDAFVRAHTRLAELGHNVNRKRVQPPTGGS